MPQAFYHSDDTLASPERLPSIMPYWQQQSQENYQNLGLNPPANMQTQSLPPYAMAQHMHHPGAVSVPHSRPAVPQGLSMTMKGRTYSLEVVQQPQRARMCGFGDKDRRPITPPPCIRLIITDAATGREVDPAEIDPSYFVLIVDLWDERAQTEVNLVRHSNSSPAVSISASTLSSFPPPQERPYIGLLTPQQYQHYYGNNPQPQGQQMDRYVQNENYGAYSVQQHGGAPNMPPQYVQAAQTPVSIVNTHSQGMYTRNLIGSLAVNATKLVDDHSKTGLWFVLQDLSVRTEGSFRLHMRFVDVASMDGDGTLNREHAPVLASCYSASFMVYSAKKFPGVVESTALSRAFATQGIKIPIRKDGNKISNQSEYDADDK